MTLLFLFSFITFVSLWNFVLSTVSSADYSSAYGEGYGTEWIFFPDGDGVPHNVSLIGTGDELIPQARSGFNDIEYRLFVRSNITDSILLNETATPVYDIEENLDLSMLPLKIITHGWRASVESDAVAAVRDAYLEKQGVNVITVDWSYIASSIFYHWVANQTEVIGIEVATFLEALAKRYEVSGSQVHLIGHSLGAHVMGIAAHHSKVKVDRVTGLDPARPLFEYPSREDKAKLDSKDASFVDIVHTCGGVLGIESNVGTADFYPNSGIPPQPGCETIPMILEACSHGRSYYYFAESIALPNSFPSYQCSNWTEFIDNNCDHSNAYTFMGDGVSRNARGNFYLKTNPKKPYGQ